ncbi:MAG: phosphoribosylglycinamide formyltransferase [Spirochaetes bacterium]|nr:MAG: phosphoribosylglycinamide formyltransferase [Spirochaetota bacterium]
MAVRKTRLAVLVSGQGSNLQALIDAISVGILDAEIALVLSSKPRAFALERAGKARIPTAVASWKAFVEEFGRSRRETYDAALAGIVAGYDPDFIFLLGWMRVLGRSFLDHFPGKVVNLHPALPGTFPGEGAIAKAWESGQAGKTKVFGAMTHFVPDEGVDSGPVILSESLPLENFASLEGFEAAMHRLEHRLVVETAKKLCNYKE